MFERFSKDTRNAVRRSAELAESEGTAMVEVEHLLTALVDPATEDVGRALVSVGVTSNAISEARERELQSALALAGVRTTRSVSSAWRRVRRGPSTRFAPSAKLALERSLDIATNAGDRRITNKVLALAIIDARVGIVPRLLSELGTNPEQLRQTIHNA